VSASSKNRIASKEERSHQGIGILQGALRRGARAGARAAPPARYPHVDLTRATVALAFYHRTGRASFSCRQVNRLRLEMVQTVCRLNVVSAVIAGTVTAYKEPGSAR
jgi:hypothetical protein